MDDSDGRELQPPTPEERRLKEAREGRIWAWLSNPEARPQNVGRRTAPIIVHPPKAREFGDADLDVIRVKAIEDYEKLGKATPEIYAARKLADARRPHKAGEMVHADSSIVERAGGATRVNFTEVVSAAARGGEIEDPKLLGLSTMDVCEKWHASTFGYEVSDERQRDVMALVKGNARRRDRADIARAGVHALHTGLRGFDAALDQLGPANRRQDPGRRVSLALRHHMAGEDDDMDPAGDELVRLLDQLYRPNLNHAALNALRAVPSTDLRKLPTGSAGLEGGTSKTRLERQFVHLVLKWNPGRKVAPNELAKFWISLGNMPDLHKLPPKVPRTPEGVIKHVADSLKKHVRSAQAALARDEEGRAVLRKLRPWTRRAVEVAPGHFLVRDGREEPDPDGEHGRRGRGPAEAAANWKPCSSPEAYRVQMVETDARCCTAPAAHTVRDEAGEK